MNTGLIGFDWPFSLSWLLVVLFLYVSLLYWHAHKLFKSTTRTEAWKLLALRGFSGLLFIILIARPYIENQQANPGAVRVISMVDLSGSMNEQDSTESERRIEQVRPWMNLERPESWINQVRSKYGMVDRLVFSSEDVSALRTSSWSIPGLGKNTSLGDALLQTIDSPDAENLGAVVLFSDGRNNTGISPLEAGQKFRGLGIPVNVIGVGQIKELGNISVAFSDIPSEILAKEELVLSAEIKNGFENQKSTRVHLYSNDLLLDSRSLTLGSGESRVIRFSPHVPETAGVRTFRVVIDSLDGDSDPSDDADVEIVQVRPPPFFSALYLSHQLTPFYPFLKRALSEERFQLSSLIRLGAETFHARGEDILPTGYPEEPDFWMNYDVVLLDSECLRELNATLVSSLKDFVQKRGGGLLLFGEPEPALELLGGVMPARETLSSRAKANLSLSVLADPLFTELKRVDEWKTFLPAVMPSSLITSINPAARNVVSLKGNSERALLVVQAYGAGKSAFWGSPHDWKRSLINEDRSREYSLFWRGIVEWLGSGTVERVKVDPQNEPSQKGEETSLNIDVLGQDFEPSMDARIEANITGPNGFNKYLQLYPKGTSLGRYGSEFIPSDAGSYRVHYKLVYPDGEKLDHVSYIKVKPSGDEAKDTRYAKRDLQMLANLTGGEFLEIDQMTDNWLPRISDSLPTLTKRNSLADAWPIFLLLFFASGGEWIIRRKGGFL